MVDATIRLMESDDFIADALHRMTEANPVPTGVAYGANGRVRRAMGSRSPLSASFAA